MCLVRFYYIVFFFLEIIELNAISVDPDQTARSARLIWVYTVCRCPVYGTLGLNGFRYMCKCNVCSCEGHGLLKTPGWLKIVP